MAFKEEINNFFNKLSFNKVESKIDYQSIFIAINGKENSLVNYFFKRIFVLIICLIIPTVYLVSIFQIDTKSIPQGKEYILYLVTNLLFIFLLFISIFIYFYILKRVKYHFLNQYKNNLLCFTLITLNVIGLGSIFIWLNFSNQALYLTIIYLILYLISSIYLIFSIITTKILTALNQTYKADFKISKWKIYLSKYPVLLVSIIIIIMQTYRMTKSYFIISGKEYSIFNIFISPLSIMFIAISLSLISTLLFNEKVFVNGKIIEKYSEEFRIKYEFTKDEWYGEK